MIYDDKKLYAELLELLKSFRLDEEFMYCPSCDWSLWDNQKHFDECILEKHITLIELDIECGGK